MDPNDKKKRPSKDVFKEIIRDIELFKSPLSILTIMTIAIFAAEALVMITLSLSRVSEPTRILLDPILLVILLSPALYFFLFRPLFFMLTEVRKAEQEVKLQRDRAQKYLDVAGAMIIVIDARRKVSLINKKGCEILGYAEKDILGKDWFENFVPERIRGEVETAFSTLMTGEVEYAGYFEHPVLTRTGEERMILFHNVPLEEGGKITGTLSSGEDITERKSTEQALRKSEARYRLVHNTAFEAIITSDANDRLIDCNPSAEKIFGYTREEMLGMEVQYLMPEKYRKRHREALRRFVQTGVPTVQGKVLEYEGLRKNGELFPIELALGSFSLGGVINFTGTVRDITERKKAEKEREIIQAQLNQAQKMEAIGRFAGGIAHDFNNILTSIRGNAELALEGLKKTDPLYQRIDGIVLSVLGASKLIRQLLIFSRRQAIEKVPLNINKVIENILGMVTRLIGEDITISTDFDPNLWTVEADEGNIEQVLMNLAVNARDAMPEGGKLSIKTDNVMVTEEEIRNHPGARPGKAVAISVADTGIGMDRELLQRIFEPFFTTKEPGKGIGFGLAVVYSIVRQHGGWITVDSEPSKGTTFRIYIPAIEEEAKKAVKTRMAPRYEGQGEGVLLVEAEERVREFTKVALSEHGYNVVEAASAEEAISVLDRANGGIRLLLVDSILPDQSGFILAERIRSKRHGLPVLVACGYDCTKEEHPEDRFKLLYKPYSIRSLLRAVKNSIEPGGV